MKKQAPAEELSFFDIFDAIPDVMGLQDIERRIIKYNEAGYRYFGKTQEEVEGVRCYELIGRDSPCIKCATQEAVETGEPSSIIKYVPENGTWLNIRAYPIKNSEGRVYRVVEHLRDITESKVLQMELERLNDRLEKQVEARTLELQEMVEELTNAHDRLIEAEKLSALSRMVAGISHEVNTPLGIAITSASYIRDMMRDHGLVDSEGVAVSDNRDLPADFIENLNQACELVNRSLTKAGNLMTGFKRIASDQTSEKMRTVNPVVYIEDLQASMHHELKRYDLNLTIEGDRDFTFNTYPGAISQVFSNLIMNSLDHAYPEGGHGEIHIRILPAVRDRNMVEIEYSDDGCGMTSETVKRIYEPFFSTSISGKGVGLGMNIVYNLVVGKLRGKINCQSKPGEGAHFSITIPCSDCP